jgi:hypothetical protein
LTIALGVASFAASIAFPTSITTMVLSQRPLASRNGPFACAAADTPHASISARALQTDARFIVPPFRAQRICQRGVAKLDQEAPRWSMSAVGSFARWAQNSTLDRG